MKSSAYKIDRSFNEALMLKKQHLRSRHYSELSFQDLWLLSLPSNDKQFDNCKTIELTKNDMNFYYFNNSHPAKSQSDKQLDIMIILLKVGFFLNLAFLIFNFFLK